MAHRIIPNSTPYTASAIIMAKNNAKANSTIFDGSHMR
jgi:hypothetical protein